MTLRTQKFEDNAFSRTKAFMRGIAMHNRRRFLQNSGADLAGTLDSGVFAVEPRRPTMAVKDDRILVVIQMDGGNDGLNTVIPFTDDNYAKSRRELRINPDSIHKLNDSLGLHPGMKEAAELYHEGLLTIVQGVGYPNPNRSHFDSMSIWHRATSDEQPSADYGWLGRAVDSVPKRDGAVADSVFVGDTEIPGCTARYDGQTRFRWNKSLTWHCWIQR